MKNVLVFLGCGCGGLARYWLASLMTTIFGRSFPFGTLFVNVSGSLIMGVLFTLTFTHFRHSHPFWLSFALLGFLGGYTTFSTFSIETIELIRIGSIQVAVYNIILSVILCLSATWLGVMIANYLLKQI
ncbi:MAG: fluoride efflux transporter CrcB [Pseudomonadota bacterium]